MANRSVPIRFELDSCATTEGTAVVVDRSALMRVGRAIAALVACLAAAFVCVFIPLLHFILVPGFLITGVVLFLLRLREGCSLVEVHGPCPRCKVQRTRIVSGRFRDGRSLHCDGCGEAPKLVVQ